MQSTYQGDDRCLGSVSGNEHRFTTQDMFFVLQRNVTGVRLKTSDPHSRLWGPLTDGIASYR
jgi:hypothetical protein